MDNLADKLIVVSGAVGDIGRACVDSLMRARARVHLIDSNSAGLADMLKGYRAQGRLTASCSTMATPKACSDALSTLQQRIYGLLHVGLRHLSQEGGGASASVWDKPQAAHLAAARDLAAACVAQLDTSLSARMVFVSPMASRLEPREQIGHAAIEGGYAALVRLLARQLAPGVLANGIAVGPVGKKAGRTPKAVRESLPLQRRAQPDEIASVAQFLLGTGSSYVTGQVIRCDGGASAG